MKLAAATIMLPRMEWPFVAEWARYLASQGVDAILILEDWQPQGYIWEKKPHPPIYWPELDDGEIADRWERALSECRPEIRIETHLAVQPPDSENWSFKQRQEIILKTVARKAPEQEWDWLLHCDADEFPGSLNWPTLHAAVSQIPADVGVAYMNQLVFESRWDQEKNYSPRRCLNLKRYNCEVVNLRKYLVRPEAVLTMGTHRVEVRAPFRAVEMEVGDAFFKHFRGVETALHQGMHAVQSFPDLWED